MRGVEENDDHAEHNHPTRENLEEKSYLKLSRMGPIACETRYL